MAVSLSGERPSAIMSEAKLNDAICSPDCGFTDGGACAGGVNYAWNLKNGIVALCCKHAAIVRAMTPELLEAKHHERMRR